MVSELSRSMAGSSSSSFDPFSISALSITQSVTVKLTEKNYLLWKSQFESFLAGQLLLGYVNGAEACPAATITSADGKTETSNPDFIRWYRQDQVVRSWILGSLSEEILAHVYHLTSSQEVWFGLASHFNKVSTSRQFELQRKLQTIAKHNLSMAEYLNAVKGVCDQLGSIGSPVPEHMKIFAALHGLGKDYESITTVIENSLSNFPGQSFESICSQLNGFEDKRKAYEVSQMTVNPHLAFAAGHQHGSQNANPGQSGSQVAQSGSGYTGSTVYPGLNGSAGFNGQGFNDSPGYDRGRGNNFRGNGQGRGRGSGSFSTRGRGFHQQTASGNGNAPADSSRPTCQICGKFGHPAFKCYKRYDAAYNNEDIAAAFAAMRVSGENYYSGNEWYPDTGASSHVTSSPANLQQSKPYQGSDSVMVGDGNFLPITHTGHTPLATMSGNLHLNDVLVCPQIAKSLLSVSKLTSDYPCKFTFDCDHVYVKDKLTKKVLTQGNRREDLYVLENPAFAAFYSTRQNATSDDFWHNRLGHPSNEVLQYLSSTNAININKVFQKLCSSCQMGKSAKLPFSASTFKATRPLERIHCDLWGPSPIKSFQGFRFYVVFIDNFSRYCWFFPLKLKSDFFQIFLQFQSFVELQTGEKIQTFQCDGGGEFTSKVFTTHLAEKGIKQLISCPHTPEQNGIAERKHRHLVEVGLSMLFHSRVPQEYWVEALFTANYLSNILPKMSHDSKKSSYEVLFNRKPEYSALRVFGSSCYPNLRAYSDNKLDPRSLQCVFLGYNDKYKGYRCLHPPTGRVYISRHVLFEESQFPFQDTYQNFVPAATTPLLAAWYSGFQTEVAPSQVPSQASSTQGNGDVSTASGSKCPGRTADLDSVPIGDSIYSSLARIDPSSISPLNRSVPQLTQQSMVPATTPTASPTSARTVSNHSTPSSVSSSLFSEEDFPPLSTPNSTPPATNVHPMVTRGKAGTTKPNPRYVLLADKVSHPEPKTVTSALKHPGWNGAMGEEYDSFVETKTFSLVPYSPDMNVLGCKWVFRTKLKADGSLDRLKARLVAKGYDQEEGIDYLDTYSPVVKTATVRSILHTATTLKWDIKQLDVKNAFLHGDLNETVYMHQPPGFIDKQNPGFVCKLHKAVYGLKQAPRAWFDKFSNFLLGYGFICSIPDPSLFIYYQNGNIMLLLLYVDDMVLTGNNNELMSHLLDYLKTEFRMKDLGPMTYFLGIQIQAHSDGLFLNQERYAEDILKIAGMAECSPAPTPLPLRLDRLSDQDVLFSEPTYFRSLAGKLQYLTLTRPDIQYAVNFICQKMHEPSVSDFNLLKRILRYLRGTTDFGLSFTASSDFTLCGYSDSDYAGCPETRRSTGGFCTFLGSNIISWSARKQETVSRSSTEAEYRSLSDTAAELAWLENVLFEIGLPITSTPLLFCDNLSAIHLSAKPDQHKKSKHFETHYHYVRERVAMQKLVVHHVPARHQLADIFTKSLPIQAFCDLRFKLGVDSPPTPSLRGNVEYTKPLKDPFQTLVQPSESPSNGKPTLSSAATVTKRISTTTQKASPCTAKSVKPAQHQIHLSNRFDALQSLGSCAGE